MAKEKEEVVEKSEREVRWEAFLVSAEKQAEKYGKENHEIFLARKESGEFDVIPDTFK